MPLLRFSQTPLTGSTDSCMLQGSEPGRGIHPHHRHRCLPGTLTSGYSVSCADDQSLGSDHRAPTEGQALGGVRWEHGRAEC